MSTVKATKTIHVTAELLIELLELPKDAKVRFSATGSDMRGDSWPGSATVTYDEEVTIPRKKA